jgi:hypothetical protein
VRSMTYCFATIINVRDVMSCDAAGDISNKDIVCFSICLKFLWPCLSSKPRVIKTQKQDINDPETSRVAK